MSEEIKIETIEETTTEEIQTSSTTEESTAEPKLPERKNPFCVISKEAFGEYVVRDIQTNSAWNVNPYGEDYAVVPDDMVEAIMETNGFCDIELNEDGTEVVAFTALEIPVIPEEPEPETEEVTTNDLANAIVEGVNEV